MKEKILKILDKTPRPIKWMFTRVGRIMTLSFLTLITFSISQLDSVSYDANAVLFYISIALFIYPLLAGLWYILNGLIINPIIMIMGDNPKFTKFIAFVRKIQFKIH